MDMGINWRTLCLVLLYAQPMVLYEEPETLFSIYLHKGRYSRWAEILITSSLLSFIYKDLYNIVTSYVL